MAKKYLTVCCTVISMFLIINVLGCTKSLIKPSIIEIDAYIKDHPDLPELDKACIYDGRFEVGMKKETVHFLLGEPNKIETVVQPWAQQEKWIYKKSGLKIFYIEDNGIVGIEQQ